MALATLQKKKAGNIKALEPKTFVRTSCLGVRFTARRRLVMAAERNRHFYTGKSSANKGATLTAFKLQTDQQEALGFNLCQGGSSCLGCFAKCFAPILHFLFIWLHKPAMETNSATGAISYLFSLKRAKTMKSNGVKIWSTNLQIINMKLKAV